MSLVPGVSLRHVSSGGGQYQGNVKIERIQNDVNNKIIADASNNLQNKLISLGYKRLTKNDNFGVFTDYYIIVDYPDSSDPNKGGILKIVKTKCYGDKDKYCSLRRNLPDGRQMSYYSTIQTVWIKPFLNKLKNVFNTKPKNELLLEEEYVLPPPPPPPPTPSVSNLTSGGKKSKKNNKSNRNKSNRNKSNRNKSNRNKSHSRKHRK
jgi:hypothetical protein